MKKLVWFDLRNVNPDDNMILPILANSCIEHVLVKAKDRKAFKLPLKMKYIVELEKEEEFSNVQKEDIVFSELEGILETAKQKELKTGIYLMVNDRAGMDFASEEGKKYDYAVIKFDCETNIPLELLIAKYQKSKTVLLKEVHSALDGKVTSDVMECGADGLLFSSMDIKEIMELDGFLQKLSCMKLKLVSGTVKEVEHIGMGYRACIDTTSMLKKNEGMLIGSFSRGGILVSSEMHYLPYMNLRPFRVNAGAVHSYIWAAEGRTEYLTDLNSGSKILVVDHEGNAREVSVGRVKIEARPLLKIVVEADGQILNTIVQDDWHIRLLGIKGEPYNASSLVVDKTILAAYVCEAGRHVGIKIEEDIMEK